MSTGTTLPSAGTTRGAAASVELRQIVQEYPSREGGAPVRVVDSVSLKFDRAGIVMLLMTIDHASDMLNGGRFVTDASWLWKPGSSIPVAQFLLRWCAADPGP